MTGCTSGGPIKKKRVNKTMNNRIKRKTMKRRTMKRKTMKRGTMKRRTMKRRTMKLKNNRKRNTISRNRKTNKNRTTGGGLKDIHRQYMQYRLKQKIKEKDKLEAEIKDMGERSKLAKESVKRKGVFYRPEEGSMNRTSIGHQDFHARHNFNEKMTKSREDIGKKEQKIEVLETEINKLEEKLSKGSPSEESATDTELELTPGDELGFTVPTQVSQVSQ